jgi:hypothetical protein
MRGLALVSAFLPTAVALPCQFFAIASVTLSLLSSLGLLPIFTRNLCAASDYFAHPQFVLGAAVPLLALGAITLSMAALGFLHLSSDYCCRVWCVDLCCAVDFVSRYSSCGYCLLPALFLFFFSLLGLSFFGLG